MFRTRILEVLTLISDADIQKDYQGRVPMIHVPNELFNQWDESRYLNDPQFQREFDVQELEALRCFDRVVEEVSAATPQCLPPLDIFLQTAAWGRLSAAARLTLSRMK